MEPNIERLMYRSFGRRPGARPEHYFCAISTPIPFHTSPATIGFSRFSFSYLKRCSSLHTLLPTRGVVGTKKCVWGGQTIRFFHLSCKLKYARYCCRQGVVISGKKSGGLCPPSQKVGGNCPPTPLFLPLCRLSNAGINH